MNEKEIRDIFAKINAATATQHPAAPLGDPYIQLCDLALQLLEGMLVNLARMSGSN